jgi:glycine cleavage system T protein (aminomethyltransferase)
MPQETPLCAWHAAHGGKMVEFAGWRLPVTYENGLIAEHLATRKFGGLFDISHMGRFLVSGPGALAFLQSALTNSAGSLAPGRAQYTLLSDHAGRPLDDAYLYCLKPGEYLLVVNASNREKDWDWLNQLNQGQADLSDVSRELAMLAVQGPKSQELVAEFVSGALPAPGRNHGAWCRMDGTEVFLSRTGYTGEPLGFEIFPPWENAERLWQQLAERGKDLGVVPVGLGARDTLRLEAGLPLYGHEYAQDRAIMSVSTAKFGVDLTDERGDFVGREALLSQREELRSGGLKLVPRRVLPVAALGRGMIREGSTVLAGGEVVGVLTSGTTVPAWRFVGGLPGEQTYTRPIGLALLERKIKTGDEIEIAYRKRTLPGRVPQRFAATAGDFLKPQEL